MSPMPTVTLTGTVGGDRLGRRFSEVHACAVRHEGAPGSGHASDAGDVDDWARERYAEHC